MFRHLIWFLYCLVFLGVTSQGLTADVETTPGTIALPPEGALIAPGTSFNFSYNIRADYGISSYNFTVWLWSSLPSALAVSDDITTGYYFGRFSEENYPANPWPANPAPSQLVMPNLSISPGGFGSGAEASNVCLYIVVIEEWANGDPTLGVNFALAANAIIYNATSTISS